MRGEVTLAGRVWSVACGQFERVVAVRRVHALPGLPRGLVGLVEVEGRFVPLVSAEVVADALGCPATAAGVATAPEAAPAAAPAAPEALGPGGALFLAAVLRLEDGLVAVPVDDLGSVSEGPAPGGPASAVAEFPLSDLLSLLAALNGGRG